MQQQIGNIQKRLQSRKYEGRRKRNISFQNGEKRSVYTFSPQKVPPAETIPGKVYVQLPYTKKYQTLTKALPDVAQIRPNKSQETFHSIKKVKLLPQLQSKERLVRYYRPKMKSNPNRFAEPTISSLLNQRSNESTARKSKQKRICSVNCLKQKQDQPQMPSISQSRNKSRKIGKQKIVKVKQRQFRIEQYPENMVQPKSPKGQLKKYIARVKLEDFDSVYAKNMYYQTFFGLQPGFFSLETLYAKQIFEHETLRKDFLEYYKPHVIPSIPSEQNMANFIHNYMPYSKNFNLDKLIKERSIYVEHSAGEFYFGEMIRNKKQGVGILLTPKSCFQGVFKDNFKVKGFEISHNGIYNGQFFNNKKEGTGEFEWINGENYVGDWKDGSRHGNGIWINRRKDSYNGEWFKGKGRGYGVYISEGKEYHGDFYDFKKDGWGREKHDIGDNYEGGFKIGIPEGRGMYRWSNGTKYEGQFSRGLRSGRGILTTLDGFIYNGQFIDEKPEGQCEISMPNGDKYQGNLRNGKKNGKGILRLSEANVALDGYWQDDRFLSKCT